MQRLKRAALAVLVVVLSATMLAASVWQAKRGVDKQAIAEQRARADALQPAPFDPAAAHGQRVAVSGRFMVERQILLDSQVSSGRVGVHVWTPLQLESGALVLVNRGWLPAPADRSPLPPWQTPADTVSLSGYWSRLPRAGMTSDNANCQSPQWPMRLVYPSYKELACLYDAPLADGIVQLGADAPHGFVRDWQLAGLTPSRHFGYAVQWLALTVCLWILTFIAWKRRERSPIQR